MSTHRTPPEHTAHRPVSMPDLTGKTTKEVWETLTKLNLTPQYRQKPALGTVTDENIVYVVQPVGPKNVPPGTVTGTVPNGGEPLPGEGPVIVNYRHHSGYSFGWGVAAIFALIVFALFGVGRLYALEEREMPNLVGQTAAQAQAQIAIFQLGRAHVDTAPAASPQNVGKVVSQTPPAGQKVDRGTPVRITVGETLPPAPPVWGTRQHSF